MASICVLQRGSDPHPIVPHPKSKELHQTIPLAPPMPSGSHASRGSLTKPSKSDRSDRSSGGPWHPPPFGLSSMASSASCTEDSSACPAAMPCSPIQRLEEETRPSRTEDNRVVFQRLFCCESLSLLPYIHSGTHPFVPSSVHGLPRGQQSGQAAGQWVDHAGRQCV